MCLVHRGIIVLLPSFFLFFFLPIRARLALVEGVEAEEPLREEVLQSVTGLYLVVITTFDFQELSLKMHRHIKMERQKFPFTIENILSKYPSSTGEKPPCETRALGFKEKMVCPDSVHHACLCCCFCSHCADMFHSDLIPEGRNKSSKIFA